MDNVVTFAYDVAGRRTSVTLPNGVVTEYTYDAASRVTGLTYRAGTTTLGTLSYMYDATGNRLRVGGTWARTGLPPALASASYDAANRHLSFGGQGLTYDLNGNLLSDGTSGYTWDARNRLTGITGPVTATFQYDATGRRTRKTISGVTTDFVHDGMNPVTESGPSGTGFLLAGLGVDDFLMRIGPGSTSMFLTDALGSLVATTDSAGGVQSELTYEPFGATELSSPAPAYRFTGREHDEPLYVYHYRARYYHTDLQRFISEDPLRLGSGDTNAYSYVRNSPLQWVDPLGLVNALRGGTVTRAYWQIRENHNAGLGFRVTITALDGSYDQYGHMDPATTPSAGAIVEPGDYIGEYADPTNGDSTNPHVHHERRGPDGRIIHPGSESPVPGGCLTSVFGSIDRAHTEPH